MLKLLIKQNKNKFNQSILRHLNFFNSSSFSSSSLNLNNSLFLSRNFTSSSFLSNSNSNSNLNNDNNNNNNTINDLNSVKDEKKWILKSQPLTESDEEVWIEKDFSDDEINQVNIRLKQANYINNTKQSNQKKNYYDAKTNPYHISKLKGFLQLNPHVCSGCGSHFQTKTPNNPGYLDKERFVEHRIKAEKLRQVQSALKLLEMSGIDPESDIAMDVLIKGNIPEEIIESVLEVNRKMKIGVPKFKFEDLDETNKPNLSSNVKNSINPYPPLPHDNINNLDDFNNSTYSTTNTTTTNTTTTTTKNTTTTTATTLSSSQINSERNNKIDLSAPYIERPILGYTIDLQPIYDVETLVKTYAQEDKLYGKNIKTYVNKKNPNKQKIVSEEVVITKPIVNESSISTTNIKIEDETNVQSKVLTEEDLIKAEDEMRSNSSFGLDESLPICQRCFRLQFYGQCQDNLRPGWTTNEELTPNKFANLLSIIRETTGVVLCLIDVFDIEGSLLPNIKNIAGKNPIVIVANKVDLLPSDVSIKRISDWIYKVVRKKCQLMTPKEADNADFKQYEQKGWYRSRENSEEGILRRSNIHLVSCKSGTGIQDLLNNLLSLAKNHGDKIYVMGTANVGKSSFVNKLINQTTSKKKSSSVNKRNAPQATVSPIPGTTLDFLKIQLPRGVLMIDTPGLINPNQLTSRLNTEELKQVIPSKQVHHITLRVEEKYCVLIGGLAKIELVEGKPLFFTFFISNEVKLHPTSVERAPTFISKHLGTSLLFPPASLERYEQIGPMEETTFDISGDSWKKSSCDIVIAGLGWIGVTGPGTFKIKVTAPKDVLVSTRESLMPYEAIKTTVRHTGGRFVQKRKNKKGYGWRA